MSETFSFLRRWPAQLLTILLLVQASLIGYLAPAEKVPSGRPLIGIPKDLNGWKMFGDEGVMEPEIMALLRADDTLSRMYLDPKTGERANLFIAFFKSQRAGVTPHSPKVCLPGAGWTPTESNTLHIQVQGRSQPISVNRYVVAKGQERSLVVYWYQTPYRIIAGEFTAKLYTMVDGLRYHRSDTSLVRVIVPIRGNEADAEKIAVQFVQSLFHPVSAFLPA